MATLESVRLSGDSPAGSSTGRESEYTRVIENEAEVQGGFSRPAHGRLDSRRETAAYFSRSVRCAQRWERLEGIPVHRHRHFHGTSAHTYRFELDAWWNADSAFADRFANQG